jgi:hypothetical protein
VALDCWTSRMGLGYSRWNLVATTSASLHPHQRPPSWIFHFRFLIVQYSKCFHEIAGPRKCVGSFLNFDTIRSANWDINISASVLPPSWILHFRFGRRVFQVFPLDCWSAGPRKWGLAVEILSPYFYPRLAINLCKLAKTCSSRVNVCPLMQSAYM